MRIFQNSGLYPAYQHRLNKLTHHLHGFAESRDAFLADRYGACHFLQPVLEGDAQAFFTNGDDANLQGKWAREQGLPSNTPLADVLLAQIEHHRAEVFYNLDPMRYGSDFIRRLPGCVKHSIAWRAAPSAGGDFSAYSLMVCNFPSILQGYKAQGMRAEYLTPAHDPVMDSFAANTERPVDVLFVGGYSRHHRRRAAVLEAVAQMRREMNIVFHLDRSRLTRWAESPLGRMLPMGEHRRPPDIRAVSAEPVFGLDLYKALSRAKIVLNGAVDMAGEDRGNMRCFEAMGCGALMVSDTGKYPPGMVDGQTMLAYSSPIEATSVIRRVHEGRSDYQNLARQAHLTMAQKYSKSSQWQEFQRLIENMS